MMTAIEDARAAVARHEAQHADDPFRFTLEDHRYVALVALIAEHEQAVKDRDDWREEARKLAIHRDVLIERRDEWLYRADAAEKALTTTDNERDTMWHLVTEKSLRGSDLVEALLAAGFRRQGPITDAQDSR